MLTKDNYKDLLKGYTILLIDGDSCASCYGLQHEIKPVCDEKNIKFVLEHIDNIHDSFLNHYEVETYPIALFFNNEKLLGKIKGFQPKEIIELWLESKM